MIASNLIVGDYIAVLTKFNYSEFDCINLGIKSVTKK